MVLSSDDKKQLLQLFYQTRSITETRRQWRKLHQDSSPRKTPSELEIRRVVEKFDKHGTVHRVLQEKQGRPRALRSIENIIEVQHSVKGMPKTSVRKRSQELGMSRMTLSRILKADLGYKPYKIQKKPLLTGSSIEKRLDMCEWLRNTFDEDPGWLETIWFSDEAHFHLNGSVNSHNNIYWSKQEAKEVNQQLAHSPKITAWCALSAQGIIGPYWFEENDETVTITQDRYMTVIRRFIAVLRRRRVLESAWFMQDGATPHTSKATIEFLRLHFNDRIMSRNTNHVWAPYSPDLNPLDFFLWGYVKSNVYKQPSRTIEELKDKVTQFINHIPIDMCQRVISNFRKRVNQCIERRGGHLK